jgi:hypothetical protein
MKDKVKLAFIISLPRSGSTLLQRILMRHSKIDSIAEPWILLPLAYALKSSGTRTTYAHSISSRGLRDLIKLMPNQEDDYYKYAGEFAAKLYASQIKSEGNYFLEKTPKYYLILPEIMKMFPDARFIFLFRNPVQIYASFLTTWGNNGFGKLHKWRHYYNLTHGYKMLSDGYELLKDRSYGIQYEQFVSDPEKYTEEILNYLELDYQEGLTHEVSAQEIKGSNVDPKVKQYKNVDKRSLSGWKNVFNSNYRKSIIKNYVEGLSEQTLSIQGYDKATILKEIDELKTNGKHNLIKDVYEFNKVKLISKYSLLSFS